MERRTTNLHNGGCINGLASCSRQQLFVPSQLLVPALEEHDTREAADDYDERAEHDARNDCTAYSRPLPPVMPAPATGTFTTNRHREWDGYVTTKHESCNRQKPKTILRLQHSAVRTGTAEATRLQ